MRVRAVRAAGPHPDRQSDAMTTPRLLTLRSGDLMLELVTSGAAVRRLVIDDGDGPVDLVLGHADPDMYRSGGGYLGATIGRFGNRIDAGRLTLDGVEYRLTTNQYGNTLHGGAEGFDAREWAVVDEAPDRVVLALTSPDGDQGFPGRLDVTVSYTVAPGTVTIAYEARTHAPTVVSLTNHAYFHLDGEGSGSVDDHHLEVAAEAFLPVREDLVPTGEIRSVDRTPFDLRAPRRIGEVLASDDEQLRLAGGIDHCYVLDGTGMRRAARLVGASGRWLEVHTDLPGLQVYTGAHFDGSTVGLDGGRYDPRAGVALETQGFPDAPNHADFPSAVLRPGDAYRTTTTWRIGPG